MASLALTTAAVSVQAQAPAPVAAATTRACSVNPVLVSSAKKKATPKTKQSPASEPLPICLEVKGETVEVQEFLQTTAREQAWRIGENRASEDSWSYVRYFSPEELAKFADTKVPFEQAKFTSGKAAVVVRTTDINNGFVRVQISARFQGEGKSTDILAQSGTIWTLNSTGILEQELVSALQTRYKPLE
jgi:hypothetical protein